MRIRRYPSGRAVLEIQFSYKGVTCKETLKTFDADSTSAQRYANNLKAEIESRIERGTFQYDEFFPNSRRARVFGKPVSSVTVAQAQAGILEDLRAAGSKEPTTLHRYECGARVIDRHIGHVRAVDLTPEDLRNIIRGTSITKKTFANYTIVLQKALRRLVHDGVIPSNPMDRVEMSDLFSQRRRPRPDPFDRAEIEQILEAASEHDLQIWNMIEFDIFSGVRIEELAALTWPDVDIEAGRLRIERAAMLSIGTAETKRVKTPAGRRTIDLLPRALEALRRQREVTGWRGEWIFRQVTRNAPISDYRHIQRRWRTVLRRAGVRYRPFKQCRHTFASHQLSSGVNRLLVAYQMGHSDTSKLDIYSRWVEDWKVDDGQAFGEMVDAAG